MADHPPFNLEEKELLEYPYVDDKGSSFRLEEVQQRKNIGIKRSKKMVFAILGVKPRMGYRWTIGKEHAMELASNEHITIKDGKVFRKYFQNEENNNRFHPFWANLSDVVGSSESGKAQLDQIIENHGFETVKPTEFIMKLLFHATDKDDIILDFFAGSGTTGHAVMKLNREDGGNRKFILVQIPERNNGESKTDFPTIADICRERLRRVARDFNQKSGPRQGFKVFKLAQSNYKIWENYDVKDAEELMKQIKLFESPLMPGYKDIDVIYECVIKEGLDLNAKIEKAITKPNTVYKVTEGESRFYICLDREMREFMVGKTQINSGDTLICIDAALTDSQKINMSRECRLRTL